MVEAWHVEQLGLRVPRSSTVLSALTQQVKEGKEAMKTTITEVITQHQQ